MVVWERVDPRIDRPEDLSQEVGSPTSPVSAISQSGVNALVARWRALADHGPSRIALVPVTADVQADLPKVALRLSQVQLNGSQVQGNGAVTPWWTRTGESRRRQRRLHAADRDRHSRGDRLPGPVG